MDAIYARQSVEKADSLSIPGQIDLCKYQVGDDFKVYEDRGYSGKNTNRPNFLRLMSDVERGLVRKIVVYRLDRFSRSIADFGRLWEVLQAHSVEFVSINETFDTSTPMGRAMLNIIIVFAQLERETTAQRVRDNYYQRAALGAWPGGPAPYGFSIGRLNAEGRQVPTLIPDAHQAIVTRIFTAYAAADASLGTVARALNAEQIPAPRRATWDNVSLSRILHSPLYVMADEDIYLYYQGRGLQFANSLEQFDGLHAAMIVGSRDRSAKKYTDLHDHRISLSNHFGFLPSDLFLACQYKLSANCQLGGNGKGKHTWLSGLLKCGSCGYSVKVNCEGDKYYLSCSGRSNLGCCDESIRVNLRALEAAVADELEGLLSQCPVTDAENDPADREIAAGVAKLDLKIDRLMAALAEGNDITTRYVNRELARLDKERQAFLEQQKKAKAHPNPIGSGRIVFRRLDFAQKKLVAAQFVQRVNLQGDRAEVLWKV
ncbi:MAG: recombinase family protein [Pseudoflavonifractor sp.]